MSYLPLPVFTCSLMMLFPSAFQIAPFGNGAYTLPREQVHRYTNLQPAPVVIVLKEQAGTDQKQKSGAPEKNAAAEEEKKTTSQKQREKKAPVKDFVPSEKIKADKAVDFPADI
jgi:hypothetical protein